MAQPAYIQKTLVMKPEVSKIFDDLDAWLDYCRFNLLPFNPADLYKSKDYRDFARPAWNGDRKNYRKDNRQKGHNNGERFSR